MSLVDQEFLSAGPGFFEGDCCSDPVGLTFASSGFFSAFGAGVFAFVDDLRAGFPLTSSADFFAGGFSVVA